MKVIVGSTKERKIRIVRNAFQEFVKEEAEFVPFEAKSGVPETPFDEETYTGAKNRANHCKEQEIADYYVGVESGLIKRYGNTFEEAWACIVTNEGKEYFGYSSGLLVPEYVLKKMEDLQLDHNSTMRILEGTVDTGKDTWGSYTGSMLSRDISLQEAVRNALIQIFAPDGSFYKK